MCGIFAYLGLKQAAPIIIEGLKGLEYRGYDSAGVASVQNGMLDVRKSVGKVKLLENVIANNPIEGNIGIGHTRWATHGEPLEKNCHPHLGADKTVAIIHNGIIENYRDLKASLEEKGVKFTSDTDSEVIANLIESYLGKFDFETAVFMAIRQLKGAYAICVINKNNPDLLITARKESPLVIGINDDGYYVASDISALLTHTNKVIYLEDDEVGLVQQGLLHVKNADGELVKKEPEEVSMTVETAEKEGYDFFMMKEIFEQPKAILDTLAGRYQKSSGEIVLPKIGVDNKGLSDINRIVITACGTSLHAALVGEFYIEKFANIPVEVEYAAEFRYRNPIIDKYTLVVAISQSGETADTLAAIKEAKGKGAKVVSICNVVGSRVTRESDGVIYTRAGIEIGVASTKAFTTQLTALFLMALYLGRIKWVQSKEDISGYINELLEIPAKIEKQLTQIDSVKKIAKKYAKTNNFLYLGRGIGFPVALEGALKMKEISYIHAEGYSAAEMKHGPIALIDEDMPVVVLATKHRGYDKVISNIQEVKARKGKVIAFATEGDTDIADIVDDVIYIPKSSEETSAILDVIPMQLLAYEVAVLRGCHVDQPRNLAKSVTVE
jgi:glutamine---fructose-6-phosphate transaminase (isomerizing)